MGHHKRGQLHRTWLIHEGDRLGEMAWSREVVFREWTGVHREVAVFVELEGKVEAFVHVHGQVRKAKWLLPTAAEVCIVAVPTLAVVGHGLKCDVARVATLVVAA